MAERHLSAAERRFLEGQRVARLATAGAAGEPHVVPVCFGLGQDTVWMTIDEKPKRDRARPLMRLRNLAENPRAALVADRYDDEWRHLGWVLVRGAVEILHAGAEHDEAQVRLRERYLPLRAMRIDDLPVIALRIERVASWGEV